MSGNPTPIRSSGAPPRRGILAHDAVQPGWRRSLTQRRRAVRAAVSSELERLQVAPELPFEVRPLQRERDGRLEPAHRRAGIVSDALELVAVDALLRHQRLDRIGQLNLAPRATRRLLELVEDLRREQITAD